MQECQQIVIIKKLIQIWDQVEQSGVGCAVRQQDVMRLQGLFIFSCLRLKVGIGHVFFFSH